MSNIPKIKNYKSNNVENQSGQTFMILRAQCFRFIGKGTKQMRVRRQGEYCCNKSRCKNLRNPGLPSVLKVGVGSLQARQFAWKEGTLPPPYGAVLSELIYRNLFPQKL